MNFNPATALEILDGVKEQGFIDSERKPISYCVDGPSHFYRIVAGGIEFLVIGNQRDCFFPKLYYYSIDDVEKGVRLTGVPRKGGYSLYQYLQSSSITKSL